MVDERYKKIDQSSLIFNHIDRLGKLISGDLESATFEDVNDYLARVRLSLMALKGLLAPFADDEYVDEIEEAENRLPEQRYRKVPTEDKMRYVEDVITAATNLLDRQNLVYSSRKQPEFGVGD